MKGFQLNRYYKKCVLNNNLEHICLVSLFKYVHYFTPVGKHKESICHLYIDLESFAAQLGHSSGFVPFLVLRFAKISRVKVGESSRWMYAFVETWCMWDAERGLLVVTGITTATSNMSLVQWCRLGFALARLKRLPAHTSRWRRCLRGRGRSLRATWKYAVIKSIGSV